MGVPQIASDLLNTNEEDVGQLEYIETRKIFEKFMGYVRLLGTITHLMHFTKSKSDNGEKG